jgi:arylsulfatase
MRNGGGGLGKDGTSSLFVNGKKVAAGRITRTQCCVFSMDEGTNVGADEATPVTEDYKERDDQFTGKVARVTIDVQGGRAPRGRTPRDPARKPL